MKRSEIREHIFKLVFEMDFHPREELSGQLDAYLEDLAEAGEEEKDYIRRKFVDIIAHVPSIDARINEVAKGQVRGTRTSQSRSLVIKGGKAVTASPREARIYEKGWSVDRMARADLAILRLACYEMFEDPDIPVKVAINEAVELAKKYGSDESGSFVNGVLARLVRSVKDDEG